MKRWSKILFLIILFSNSYKCIAQEENYENYESPAGLNNAFIELGGAAIKFSLNYEKYLWRNRYENVTITGRVGAGYQFNDRWILNRIYLEQGSFLFPITFQGLIGSGKNKLELGGGFTMLTSNFAEAELIPSGVLGLRVMESNGVCFRITYTPLIKDTEYINWLGVSLGYNFSFK
jgi:hypothetical protein